MTRLLFVSILALLLTAPLQAQNTRPAGMDMKDTKDTKDTRSQMEQMRAHSASGHGPRAFPSGARKPLL
jgi:hypothetical protein